MSDTLEAFILEGPEREVDAWWAEKGMGIRTCLLEEGPPGECRLEPYDVTDFNDVGYPIPHYTTDRALSHVIEDRLASDEINKPWYYAHELLQIVTGGPTLQPNEIPALWKVLAATNRQRILAAARAMGLER